MERKNQTPYFVCSCTTEHSCLIVVPAKYATRCADYLDQKWYNSLTVNYVETRSNFITCSWCSFEPVGVLSVSTKSDEVIMSSNIECVAMAGVASFFSYEVNEEDDGK